MKKIITGVIVIILIIVGVSYFGKNSKQSAVKEPIKIGFVGPLSGEGASFGETEKNATELALQDINADPKSPKFEVVYEDGKCNGKDATSAIQKLISIDNVKIILGGTCSSETLAMAPIAEQNKVLMLSAFSSNPAITNAGDYIFRNSPKDTDVAYLDADTIAKLYKKVALISENTDYSQGVREVMKKVFTEKGIIVVADELYSNTGSQIVDFRSLYDQNRIDRPRSSICKSRHLCQGRWPHCKASSRTRYQSSNPRKFLSRNS